MSFPSDQRHINPHQTYICTKKEVQEYIDRTGTWMLFNGQMYDLQTKKVFEDRYEVSFKRRNYD